MKFFLLFFEAKPFRSHQFLVPLSDQMLPVPSAHKANASGSITTSIGAILKALFYRLCFFNFNFYFLRLVLLLLICSFISQTSSAQIDLKEHHVADVIFFKNGGMLYGEILNIEDNVIEFKMTTGKVANIEMRIVKKIIQKFNKEGTTEIEYYLRKPYQFKEQGIYNLTYVNLPQGFNERNRWDSGLGIHHITGKQFNRWLGTGLGVGFDGYQINNGRNVLSVYQDFRGYLKAQNFSPYYSLGVGYGFGIRNKDIGINKTKGGLYFNPSIGYRFGGSAGANFVMGLGYKLQVATFEWNGWNSINRQRYVFKRLNVSIGVLF